jgi:hypothetical protein
MAKIPYNIVTGVEPHAPGNGLALRTLSEDWNDRVNKTRPLIHLGCCDELLPFIDDIEDPVDIFEALTHRLGNSSTYLCRTHVLHMFSPSRPWPDETVPHYFTKRFTIQKEMIGSTQNIIDDTMKIPVFTTQSSSYETTIEFLASATTLVSV